MVAGALSPADGLKVIATRSKLMSRLSGQGAMALLELGAAGGREVDRRLSRHHGGGVCRAAADGDRRAARAGRCGDRGGGRRRAGWRGASRWMWPRTIRQLIRFCPSCAPRLADLAPITPKIPLISTVGQTRRRAPTFDADYWVVNLRNPVRFSQAVATAAAHKHTTFVEVSPHPLLTHAITENVGVGHSRAAVSRWRQR